MELESKVEELERLLWEIIGDVDVDINYDHKICTEIDRLLTHIDEKLDQLDQEEQDKYKWYERLAEVLNTVLIVFCYSYVYTE